MIKKKNVQIFLFLFVPSLLTASCASSPMIQPQINGLVAAEKYHFALKLLEKNKQAYGDRSRLLYLLDYGLVLHLAGRYQESISAFEQAKNLFDELYVISLSRQSTTWMVNDNLAPYRGEDFERVMINIFQALNFAALGDLEGALVEARNVDRKLTAMNLQYKQGQKNVYKEDAFARFLMGVLYETSGTSRGLNDAFISYARALEIYERDGPGEDKMPVPRILKENLLAAAQWMGPEEFERYKRKFGNIYFTGLKQRKQEAQVYVIHYYGLSPVKHEFMIPVPLPEGIVTKIAFPVYEKRPDLAPEGILKAVGVEDGRRVFQEKTEPAEDISAIAIQNLENRKVRVLVKAALRAGGKYAAEAVSSRKIRDKYGDTTADIFNVSSSLYNLASERADLRSWQTLPSEIRVGRLLLNPGRYRFFLNDEELGEIEVKAGETKFLFTRTNR